MIKFTIIYVNSDDVRNGIFNQLIGWSKKVDLTQGINGGNFRIVPNWPTRDELEKLPLNFQAEEIVIENNIITSIRKFIYDVEIIQSEQQPIEETKENLAVVPV